MAKEVSPELLEELKTYLNERERSETTLLSFFYKELFGRELKISCGGCIEDGVRHLKTISEKKQRQIMNGNYKWIGGDRTAKIRFQGKLIEIGKKNFTDEYGETLSNIPKYAHLVEFAGGQSMGELKGSLEGIIKKESEVTISTLIEQPSEEVVVKKRGRKPKLK